MTATQSDPTFDEGKFHEFLGKMLGDVGAAITGSLAIVGDRLGFYRTLADKGPMTSMELAVQTGTAERYVREWLANQAASGYLTYDAASKQFTLPRGHAPQRAANDVGVQDRVTFEIAPATAFPGSGYDFIACFDCIHDMGDPVGAAMHIRSALAKDGTFMMVEPFANDALEDNLNPVGRIFYAASTMLCTPASLDQEVGLALGAQAGEARIRSVFSEAGFSLFHRATETPFNIVYEARA